MIKLQIIGNLGRDALTNQVNTRNVINFSVAHTERFKDAQGNQKERVTWVDCAYWTDRVGIVPYLKKGTLVYVEGSPEVRQYSRNDGTAGATLSLRVSQVQLLGGPNNNSDDDGPGNHQSDQTSSSTQSSAPTGTPNNQDDAVDDLPF